MLSAFGAIPDEGRVVVDGPVVTGGGVTAGIDLALALVEDDLGRAAALAVASPNLIVWRAPSSPSARPPASQPAAFCMTRGSCFHLLSYGTCVCNLLQSGAHLGTQ